MFLTVDWCSMNVNNQLGSRPGIRLFPGHSAGGSFSGNSGIIGGGAPTMDAFQAKTHTSQNDASRILKQMQALSRCEWGSFLLSAARPSLLG